MIKEFHAPAFISVACTMSNNIIIARDWSSNTCLLDSDANVLHQGRIARGISDSAVISPDGRIFFCSDRCYIICNPDGTFSEKYEFDDYPTKPYFLSNGNMLFGCGNKILSGSREGGFKTIYEDTLRVSPLPLDSGNILVHVQKDNSPNKHFIMLNPLGEITAQLPSFSCSVSVHSMPDQRIALWFPKNGAKASSQLQTSIYSETGNLLTRQYIEYRDPIPILLNDGLWAMTAGNYQGNFVHILDDNMKITESYPFPDEFNAAIFNISPDGDFIAGDLEGNVCIMSRSGKIQKLISLNNSGGLKGKPCCLKDGTVVIGSREHTLYFIKPDEYAV